MSLVILTKSPKFNLKEFINNYKKIIKFILGQKRGPSVVTESLLKGLSELGIEYKYNIKEKEIMPTDVVYINESQEGLKWAIKCKKERRIKKLIAGPVISVLPNDYESIMLSKEIDIVLFPSQWTKNNWLSKKKYLDNKIQIWPAGVSIPESNNDIRNKVLIYYKKAPKKLLIGIKNFLDSREIKYEVVIYGKYKQSKYFSLLNKTKFAIFLSESESQGLAMFEAWAHDVPTIVWNRGYWQYGVNQWFDDKISAPYLLDMCGLFFKDMADFQVKFETFIKGLDNYQPKQYVVNNFTNKIVAEKFINIIKN